MKRIAVIVASWVAVVTGVVLLTALTLGYQFNSKDGHVQRGGILQIGSKPSGAKITINGKSFRSTTPAKHVSKPGEYALEIEKQGYRPWQKSVPIQPGGITWATYPRLVPEKLTPSPAADLPETLLDALPSGSGKRYAFMINSEAPVIGIANLDEKDVTVAETKLPDDSYTLPSSEDAKSTFELAAWSGNERMILIHHTYGNEKEWILFNREKPAASVNLSQISGVSLADVEFANSDGTHVYALVNHALRLLDVSSQTLGRPIVEEVAEYSVFEDGYLLFVTLPSQQKTQQVGYVKREFKQPKVVDVVPYDGENSTRFAVGKYYDTYYFLVAQGKEAVLSSSKSLTGDAATPINRKVVKTLKLDEPITKASITNSGQFAMVRGNNSFATYNSEIERLSVTTLASDDTKSRELRHLDPYLLWSDYDGKLRTYEFDGGNQHDIMTFESRFKATLSSSGKYLYGVQKAESGYQLVRVQFLDI